MYTVGARVDGLYDGNSDGVWYPGYIQAAHDHDDTYDVLYDDGESEHHVQRQYLRLHQRGTMCVGTKVFGKYAGGDEWYPGKIQEVGDDGSMYTIGYDDGEVEAGVILAFIKEPMDENEPSSTGGGLPTAAEVDVDAPAPAEENDGGDAVDTTEEAPSPSSIVEAPALPEPDVALAEPIRASNREPPPEPEVVRDQVEQEEEEEEQQRQPEPIVSSNVASIEPASVAIAASHTVTDQERSGAPIRARIDEDDTGASSKEPPHPHAVDEYATILSTMEELECSSSDALATKSLLSTLVKQMRAFPQATAELVHSRKGEALLVNILTQHHTHAVIQCYGFVLLRRLCFLCGKSTHFLLRNGIIELVAIAMRKFPEDAILQASACGALAVFTRVHAGLTALLANRVSHLVLATIIFHKSYSVHTRQVHYYACEVLLELCELSDHTTIEALCGDAMAGPAGLSDLSPVSLLLFLLRQALSFDDKKACCAVGTLLMCLATCHRHAAKIVLDLNGLSELSTVMAKFPMEPGIQKYAASASKEIAICSMESQQQQPYHHHHHGEASHSMEKQQRLVPHKRQQQGRAATKSKAGAKKKSAGPSHSSNPSVSALNGFPSPSHQQYAAEIAATSRDALSFAKFASPIGRAPGMPPNIRNFADPTAASPSAGRQQHYQQNSTMGSSLVILDEGHGGSSVHKKQAVVKEERKHLLFETYGVDAKMKALHHPQHQQPYGDHFYSSLETRPQGIKRRQLKTHLVSASSRGDGDSYWASPVKATILANDSKPLSSRSDKPRPATKAVSVGGGGATPRKVRSSNGSSSGRAGDGSNDGGNDGEGGGSEEGSPATLRKIQPVQPQGKTKPKPEMLQLKLSDGGSASSGSSGALASSRGGGNSKAKKTKPAAAVSSRSKGEALGSRIQADASSESLNSYATQLFKDEMNAPVEPLPLKESDAIAQERERLSFAEKLHKMIDKAKSSLAQGSGSTVSLETDAVRRSVKVTTTKSTAPTPKTKKPAPIAKTEVMRPPAVVAAAKPNVPLPLPAKKKVVTGVSSSLYTPPVSKSVVSRPTVGGTTAIASSSSSVAKAKAIPTSASKTKAKPTATTTTTTTTTATATTQEAEKKVVLEPTRDTVSTVHIKNEENEPEVVPVPKTVSSPRVYSEENSTTQEATSSEDGSTTTAAVVVVTEPPRDEVLSGEAPETEPVASAHVSMPEPTESTPSLDESPVSELESTAPHEAVEVAAQDDQAQAEPAEAEATPVSTEEIPTPPAVPMVESVVVAEAVAVCVESSAADDLYADEYNDFEDENAPPTMDEDDGMLDTQQAHGMNHRNGSFEALMDLTAHVTARAAVDQNEEEPEFTVASMVTAESIVADDEPRESTETAVDPEQGETTTTYDEGADVGVKSEDVTVDAETVHGDSDNTAMEDVVSPTGELPLETADPVPVEETVMAPQEDNALPVALEPVPVEEMAVAGEASVSVLDDDVEKKDPSPEVPSLPAELAVEEPGIAAVATEEVHADVEAAAERDTVVDTQDPVVDTVPASEPQHETEPHSEPPLSERESDTDADATVVDRPESRGTEASYGDDDFEEPLGDEAAPAEEETTEGEAEEPVVEQAADAQAQETSEVRPSFEPPVDEQPPTQTDESAVDGSMNDTGDAIDGAALAATATVKTPENANDEVAVVNASEAESATSTHMEDTNVDEEVAVVAETSSDGQAEEQPIRENDSTAVEEPLPVMVDSKQQEVSNESVVNDKEEIVVESQREEELSEKQVVHDESNSCASEELPTASAGGDDNLPVSIAHEEETTETEIAPPVETSDRVATPDAYEGADAEFDQEDTEDADQAAPPIDEDPEHQVDAAVVEVAVEEPVAVSLLPDGEEEKEAPQSSGQEDATPAVDDDPIRVATPEGDDASYADETEFESEDTTTPTAVEVVETPTVVQSEDNGAEVASTAGTETEQTDPLHGEEKPVEDAMATTTEVMTNERIEPETTVEVVIEETAAVATDGAIEIEQNAAMDDYHDPLVDATPPSSESHAPLVEFESEVVGDESIAAVADEEEGVIPPAAVAVAVEEESVTPIAAEGKEEMAAAAAATTTASAAEEERETATPSTTAAEDHELLTLTTAAEKDVDAIPTTSVVAVEISASEEEKPIATTAVVEEEEPIAAATTNDDADVATVGHTVDEVAPESVATIPSADQEVEPSSVEATASDDRIQQNAVDEKGSESTGMALPSQTKLDVGETVDREAAQQEDVAAPEQEDENAYGDAGFDEQQEEPAAPIAPEETPAAQPVLEPVEATHGSVVEDDAVETPRVATPAEDAYGDDAEFDGDASEPAGETTTTTTTTHQEGDRDHAVSLSPVVDPTEEEVISSSVEQVEEPSALPVASDSESGNDVDMNSKTPADEEAYGEEDGVATDVGDQAEPPADDKPLIDASASVAEDGSATEQPQEVANGDADMPPSHVTDDSETTAMLIETESGAVESDDPQPAGIEQEDTTTTKQDELVSEPVEQASPREDPVVVDSGERESAEPLVEEKATVSNEDPGFEEEAAQVLVPEFVVEFAAPEVKTTTGAVAVDEEGAVELPMLVDTNVGGDAAATDADGGAAVDEALTQAEKSVEVEFVSASNEAPDEDPPSQSAAPIEQPPVQESELPMQRPQDQPEEPQIVVDDEVTDRPVSPSEDNSSPPHIDEVVDATETVASETLPAAVATDLKNESESEPVAEEYAFDEVEDDDGPVVVEAAAATSTEVHGEEEALVVAAVQVVETAAEDESPVAAASALDTDTATPESIAPSEEEAEPMIATALPGEAELPAAGQVDTAVSDETASPAVDDAEYDDFEPATPGQVDEPVSNSPQERVVADPEIKRTEENVVEEKEQDETYADDNDDEYNDFEEDSSEPVAVAPPQVATATPPSPLSSFAIEEPATAAVAATVSGEDADDAYATEDAFEDEESKSSPRIEQSTDTPAATTALPTPTTPTAEEEYGEEYEDFED